MIIKKTLWREKLLIPRIKKLYANYQIYPIGTHQEAPILLLSYFANPNQEKNLIPIQFVKNSNWIFKGESWNRRCKLQRNKRRTWF